MLNLANKISKLGKFIDDPFWFSLRFKEEGKSIKPSHIDDAAKQLSSDLLNAKLILYWLN